jgi:carbon-monoxide dehydrogenase medium subunit
MFPRAFEYQVPSSIAETLELLAADPEETKVLAGGHSLLPMMKLRLAAPRRLLDLRRLRGELAYARAANGGVAIGALTTYHALLTAPDVAARCPLLVEAADQVGDRQVRNRGTIGGSLAHGDPAADMPAVMLALDAQIEAQGPQGSRRIAATDFFQGLYTTALASTELLTAIHIPALPDRAGAAYAKFRNPASGYAVVGVAALVALDPAGKIAAARVGITGVSDHAYRATAVEQALVGAEPTAEALAAAAAHAADGIDPLEDLFASADFRRHLTRVQTERALREAVARARAG